MTPKQFILKIAPTNHVQTMALVTAITHDQFLHHYIVDPSYRGLGFASFLAQFEDCELDVNLIQVYADIMKTKQHETFFVIWAEDLEFSRSFHAIPINQQLGDTFKKIYNEAHANSLLTGIICPNAFEKQADMSKDALELLENLFIGDTCFATFIRGDNPERAHQLLDGVTRQDRIVQRDYLNKIKYP